MIRVFPRRTHWTPTDPLAFYGPPGLFPPELPRSTPVHVSVTFTWDKPRAETLKRDWAVHFDNVQIGGPAACDVITDLPSLEKTSKMLDGIPIRKRRCYTMINPQLETFADAERRLERVLE